MAVYNSLAAAYTAYRAGLDYASSGSVESAQQVRDACLAILSFLPAEMETAQGERSKHDLAVWERRLAEVNSWLTANSQTAAQSQPGAGRVSYVSFGGRP